MATAKAKPEAEVEDAESTAQAATGFSPDQWAAINDELATAGSMGEIQYLKEGRTRIRFLPHQSAGPQELFHEVERTYQGQKRTKYMLPGIVWVKNQAGAEEPTMKALVVPKTVLKQIISLLGEGYDLFSAEAGHAISITKNAGSPPTFTTMPSMKPVPIPEIESYKLTESLDALAKKLTERDEQRANKDNDAEGGRQQRNRKDRGRDGDEDGEDW